METRVALISIIVENNESAAQINALLHDYSSYIVGRMGIPYRERCIHIISIAIDAPKDKIDALAEKIGRVKGAAAKTVYSDVVSK